MKVDISDITRVNGASLDLSLHEDRTVGVQLLEGYTLSEPVRFSGNLTNMNGILKLDGRLKTGYKVMCYRCLGEIERQLDITMLESIVNGKSDIDEPDAYTYTGDYLELDKIIEDNIILNLPMKQVCTQECKGLCQKCGANLNEGSCSCKEDSVNPHMESLKKFFSKKN
ncbi:MAG: DUF177 domain-containing protein [Ruminiclostridium sp.]|nr:DUF177 domain-containing protein [Ruminiclostridium sp.]